MTFKLNVENLSLPDGDVPGGIVGGRGGGRCCLTPDGRRRVERASSMPGRVPSPGCRSTLTLSRRSLRPRRSPLATVTALPVSTDVLPLTHAPEPPDNTDCGGKVKGVETSLSMDVEVTVSPASTSGSTGRISTASSAIRRQLGSTSFIFRRKRVLGVPVDENSVPQIDRAVSPVPPPPTSPTVTVRDAAVAQEQGRQPIYTRRFASLRLPSGARTPGCSSSRYQASSTLLSPVSAANGASVHRSLSGSYARMQLLQNIGKQGGWLSIHYHSRIF